jgi:hypothetical protein
MVSPVLLKSLPELTLPPRQGRYKFLSHFIPLDATGDPKVANIPPPTPHPNPRILNELWRPITFRSMKLPVTLVTGGGLTQGYDSAIQPRIAAGPPTNGILLIVG